VDKRLGTGEYAKSGPTSYQDLIDNLSTYSRRKLEKIVKKAIQQGGLDNTTSLSIQAFETTLSKKFPGCDISSLIVDHIRSSMK